MDYGDKPAAAKRSLLTPPRWSLFAPPLTLAAKIFARVPDLHFEELRHYVTPEIAVVEAVTTGTPLGGKPYEAHLVDVLTLRDGKIAAKRSYRKGQV